jgi:hypothetical protein
MRNQRIVVALVCAMLAVVTSARAQESSAQAKSHAAPEITPYVFLGSLASSGVGAAVRWPLPGRFSVELEANYRRSAVSPANFNLSFLFDLPEVARVTPYVAGGVGLDQYAFADLSPAGNVIKQVGTAFSVNAGGGVRIRGDENWGIRADARWFNGLAERAPERWRLYNGVTFGRKEQ